MTPDQKKLNAMSRSQRTREMFRMVGSYTPMGHSAEPADKLFASLKAADEAAGERRGEIKALRELSDKLWDPAFTLTEHELVDWQPERKLIAEYIDAHIAFLLRLEAEEQHDG